MLEFCWDGIRIQIHLLFLGMLTIFLLLDETGISGMAVGASLLHELGHFAACYGSGSKPRGLSFELTGIRMTEEGRPLPWKRELWILLAGSGVNFLLAAVCFIWKGTQSMLVWVNLCLGIVNLLPVSALDGGKILRLCLEQKVSLHTAAQICIVVQIILIVIATLGCLLGMTLGNLNFTALVFCVYLIMGAFKQ
ncbi:MAG: site-2 protease family protein [Massiliimalia sp.]|jgi:Zn-dependent protease